MIATEQENPKYGIIHALICGFIQLRCFTSLDVLLDSINCNCQAIYEDVHCGY